jgi:hypothetical protein
MLEELGKKPLMMDLTPRSENPDTGERIEPVSQWAQVNIRCEPCAPLYFWVVHVVFYDGDCSTLLFFFLDN